MSRAIDAAAALGTALLGIGFVTVVLLASIVGQVGFLVAMVATPFMGMLAVIPGRGRAIMWRWLRHLLTMLTYIFSSAAILLVFFFLLKVANALAETTPGPAWMTRIIYMSVLAYMVYKAFRSLAASTREWAKGRTTALKTTLETATKVAADRDGISKWAAREEAAYDQKREKASTKRRTALGNLRGAVVGGVRTRVRSAASDRIRRGLGVTPGAAARLGLSRDPQTGKAKWSAEQFAEGVKKRAAERLKETGEQPGRLRKVGQATAATVGYTAKTRRVLSAAKTASTPAAGVAAVAELLGHKTPEPEKAAPTDAEAANALMDEATQHDPHAETTDERNVHTATTATTALREAQSELHRTAERLAEAPTDANRDAHAAQAASVRSALGAGAIANPGLVRLALDDPGAVLGEHRSDMLASLAVADGVSSEDRVRIAETSPLADNALWLHDPDVGPAVPARPDAGSTSPWARAAAAAGADAAQLAIMADGEQSLRVQHAIRQRAAELAESDSISPHEASAVSGGIQVSRSLSDRDLVSLAVDQNPGLRARLLADPRTPPEALRAMAQNPLEEPRNMARLLEHPNADNEIRSSAWGHRPQGLYRREQQAAGRHSPDRCGNHGAGRERLPRGGRSPHRRFYRQEPCPPHPDTSRSSR